MRINVLLTGAGGNLAHFIYNALNLSDLPVSIIASDYSHMAVGLYKADKGYVIPAASDPSYLPRIKEICKQERIDIIMVGGMVEMRILAFHKNVLEQETGAILVAPDYDLLRMLEDKWTLMQNLKKIGFDYPESVLPAKKDNSDLEGLVDKHGFPLIVKDRFGSGSKGVCVVNNFEELYYQIEHIPNPMVQEYLYPDNEEYTIGVFMTKDEQAAASIVMKRQLNLGMTFKAHVLPNSPLAAYSETVLNALKAQGPVNVQLRLTERGPVIFEINPRFSSTVSARAKYGYNAPEMAIRHYVLHESIARPEIKPGYFFRVIEEVCVSENLVKQTVLSGRTNNTSIYTTAENV